jgi:hypothetical protein
MCVRLSLEKIANSNRFQMCGWRKWQREKLAKIDGENGSEEKS